MKNTAADIMTRDIPSLFPETPLPEAIRIFQESSRQTGRRVFGLLVTDHDQRLVGMLSMYDILLFVRPKHIQVWGTMEDIDVVSLLDSAAKRLKSILVGDIMSLDVITVGPEVNLLMVLDIMIKKHVRRLPVVEDQRILGMVYISDLFNHLLDRAAN